MEIHIRLAGIQFGPYSEKQVREYLSEGLLLPTDPARGEGTENWIVVDELLSKLPPPTEVLPKLVPTPAPGEVSGAPKGAPDKLPPQTDIPPKLMPEPAPGEVSGAPKPAPDKLPPQTDIPPKLMPEPAPEEVSGAPKRAPDAAPGVTHLPSKPQPQDKRTMLLGPTAPAVPTPSGKTSISVLTTSPLVPAPQGTKRIARESLAKALAQKTAPLPTKAIVSPVVPPSSPAPTTPEAPEPTREEAPKASLPPLMKALMARTAPMRSTSIPAPVRPAATPAPAPPAERSVAAPASTKSVRKPVSEPLPPPSVVDTLSKRLVMPDKGPAPGSRPTPELPVETAQVAPSKTKTKTEEAPAAPAPDQPIRKPVPGAASRRIMPALIYACAALALLTFYYVWSPYHAAPSLLNALEEGNPDALNGAIDFPSVRASLKEQIKNQIAQSGVQDVKNNSSAASTLSTLLSMIDHSIDLYVTPEGISELAKKSGPIWDAPQPETMSPEVAAKILLAFNSLPVKNQGLASLGDFVLDRDAVMLHLRLVGMGWRLEQVDLRPNLGLPTASGSAAPLLFPMADTYMGQGNARSQKGDWDRAIADFTQVLAIEPQSTAAYSARGGARLSKGDLDGAVKDYTQALALNPQMAAAYEGRGNAEAAKNNLDAAIADYTQAIRLDPARAPAYDGRGNAKTAKDDLDGAIADFTQAITIDPNLAGAYNDRGFARQANGNLDGAISDYTQALALNPKTAIAYYHRGLARQSQGNLEAAIVDYDRALAFDPKIAGAYFNRGNAKNANHDLDGAISDYTQALTLNPKIALAFCNRGLARQGKGDLDGAMTDYTHALAIDPKIAIAYYNRALIEAQKNNLDSAIADNSQALYLDPKNAMAYYTRGFAKLAKGNLDGALADLKQFCNLVPRDHNADHARLYLWLISKAQNSKPDADQELSDALANSWNSSLDELTSKTAAFLLGRVTEADYLAAAASPDAKTDQGRHCEAWYFSGMKRLLMADKKGAVDAFHQCLATRQKDYCEYILAEAELQALEPAPSPNPAPSNPPPAPGPAPAPAATGAVPGKSP